MKQDTDDTVIEIDWPSPMLEPGYIPTPEDLDKCEEVWKQYEERAINERVLAGMVVDDEFLATVRKRVENALKGVRKRRIRLGYSEAEDHGEE